MGEHKSGDRSKGRQTGKHRKGGAHIHDYQTRRTRLKNVAGIQFVYQYQECIADGECDKKFNVQITPSEK